MDDPWGSPWTADNEKDQKAPPSPTKSTRSTRSDLEPPPRVFLSVSNSPRIPTIASHSPWADEEDGFGDWAAPDTVTSASTQSGWAGGWTSPNPNSTLASPPRNHEFGQASPIAWPGNIAVPKPANASSIRQPSPDPWAAEFSSQTPTNDGPLTPTGRPAVNTFEAEIAGGKQNGNTDIVITSSEWDDYEPFDESIETQENTRRDAFTPPPSEEPTTTQKEEAPRQSPTRDGPVRSSAELPVRGRSLRSSSPSEADSDGEDDRQDSPITSIDEDSKARQQVVPTTSGKVQELVNKFDVLARAASVEPPINPKEGSKSSQGYDETNSSDDDNAGDFGDFEDIDEDIPPRPSTPLEEEVRPRPIEHSPATPSRQTVEAASTPQLTATTADSKRQSLTRFDSVVFDVDLDKVEELLGENTSHVASEASVHDANISDRIITDSFTEISERKTWYRISRLGSSRKHNAGDEENYRRVGWDSSAIRLDTIKIVRRWMEEDSIAGRANLGGGTSKTQRNMFGWDSSAEPVTLDAVFGKKKGHSRASSLQAPKPHEPTVPGSTTELRQTSASLRSATQRPSSPALPAPGSFSFGWSTGSPSTQTSQATSNPPLQSPARVESPSFQIPAPKPIAQPLVAETHAKPLAPIPPPATSKTLPLSISTNAPLASTNPSNEDDDDDDDDDDWGEMVTSPSQSKPTSNGFLDLAEAFSAARPISPATSPIRSQTLTEPPVSAFNTNAWGPVDFSIFEKPVQAKQPPPTRLAVITKPTPTPVHPGASTTTPFTPSNNTLSSSLLSASATTPISAVSTGPGYKAAAPPITDSHFTPTTPLAIASPVVLPISIGTDSGNTGPGKLHDQQDEAALCIIANLPDLSYMLR